MTAQADITCACGRPLHYTDPQIEAVAIKFTQEYGEYIPITTALASRWEKIA